MQGTQAVTGGARVSLAKSESTRVKRAMAIAHSAMSAILQNSSGARAALCAPYAPLDMNRAVPYALAPLVKKHFIRMLWGTARAPRVRPGTHLQLLLLRAVVHVQCAIRATDELAAISMFRAPHASRVPIMRLRHCTTIWRVAYVLPIFSTVRQ